MYGNRSRLASGVATLVIAALSSRGVWDLWPGLEAEARLWLGHTIDLLLLVAYHAIERQVESWAPRAAPPALPSPPEAIPPPKIDGGTTNVSLPLQ